MIKSSLQQMGNKELGSAFDILLRASSSDEAAKLVEIAMKWNQYDKDSFIFQYNFITKIVLRSVVNMPLEMQAILRDGFEQIAEAIRSVREIGHTLVDNIEYARSEFQEHWYLAVQERNSINETLDNATAKFKEVIQWNAAAAREREANLLQMIKDRESRHIASISQREVEAAENNKRVVSTAKYVCSGIAFLGFAFSGLFCATQWQGRKLFELQTQADVAARVSDKLQHVEPSTLQLASAFERGSHQVMLRDGTYAWEIDLSGETGFFSADVVQDETSQRPYVRVFMRDDPNRMSVATLAAAVKTSAK